VLVSHLHADHLHAASLRQLPGTATLVLPAGGAGLAVRSWSGAVHEVDVGDAVALGAVTVRAVPARHDGRRLPGSRHRGPALGYVVEAAGQRIWFAGDTGWFPGLADVGPIDVALLPVGGWGPTLGEHHLDPDEAARAAAAVGARHAVPIHFGTLWPIGLRRLAPAVFRHRFELPGERFATAVARAGTPTDVHLLRCGQTVELGDE
jgi:L-ascorbate metabolism protein UlaG (beta-lactamase superfamily)